MNVKVSVREDDKGWYGHVSDEDLGGVTGSLCVWGDEGATRDGV